MPETLAEGSTIARLQAENAALLARVGVLHAALEGITADHSEVRRVNARLRAELKYLRGALGRTDRHRSSAALRAVISESRRRPQS